MRWAATLSLLAVAAALTLLGAMAVSRISDNGAGEDQLIPPPLSPALVARGAYLAKLGDCAACHSLPGKPAFSGGLEMATPIGAIYTTNITPDLTYGIGEFTLEDFDRALRFGVARGHTLYPAMPFASYANTTPYDVAALFAYFKTEVPAAAIPNRENDIPFPLSMRWPLSFWRMMFAPRPHPFVASPGMDEQVAQGAYFVEGLGHCGECHTPRALTMQVKAQTSKDGPTYLSGAVIENYFAPSLRSGGAGTIGDWNEDDLVRFLQTGANDRGIVFGAMRDVVVHSTQFMTDVDALAAARYLKTLTDETSNGAVVFRYDNTVSEDLRAGDTTRRGAQVYLDNCAACHRPDGRGYDRVFPELAGNPVVRAPNPISLTSIVLAGSRTPVTAGTPAQFTMPSFAWRLSDREVADVVTFIRRSWGNDATPISASDVASQRMAFTGASK